MKAIQCISICKAYRHYEVLKDISLEINPGECYALFGPNGAGKTTLLRILATIHRPSGGQFIIDGHDGVREKIRVRESLFLIAHGSYLYDDLSAVENIRFAAGLRGKGPSDREIKLALDRVGIGAFSELRTRYFSAGMKKRLSIAKSILIRPQVLLMDEPYASLDEKGQQMVNNYLSEITRSGGTVFMTTHDRARTAEVAHRAGVLTQGILSEIPVQLLKEIHDIF
ncbi:MAG: heme ABC exporter ATP-binding protein CcmA [Nitrospirae bacterium]|nr:heme ABC exporter ATP-binding protein CcmA [Nitrospirota bacterium]